MNDIAYKLKRTLAGKMRVAYACPNCAEKLENELSEAGNGDACPACGTVLVVPGAIKKEQIERDRAAKAARERAAAEARASKAGKSSRIGAELDSIAESFVEPEIVPPKPTPIVESATLNEVVDELRQARREFAAWRRGERESGWIIVLTCVVLGGVLMLSLNLTLRSGNEIDSLLVVLGTLALVFVYGLSKALTS